jgi:glutaryl-CoA dehydrogenase
MFARHILRQKSLITPRLVSRTMASKAFVKYNWEDPLNLERLLTEEEVFIRDAVRDYCQDRLQPRVLEAYRNESK